jgi:YD repeat-containing protein
MRGRYLPWPDSSLRSAIAPEGETLAGYSYDANNHLLTSTNAVSEVASYTYDSQGRLTNILSPAAKGSTQGQPIAWFVPD